MIFDSFDTRKASSIARPLHIKHPATGEPLFDNEENPLADNGKPCLVMVKGVEAPDVVAAIKAAHEGKGKDQEQNLIDATKPLIVGFENIDREVNGEARPATAPDDVVWFLRLQRPNGRLGQMSFLEQVSTFAMDRTNYLGNLPKG